MTSFIFGATWDLVSGQSLEMFGCYSTPADSSTGFQPHFFAESLSFARFLDDSRDARMQQKSFKSQNGSDFLKFLIIFIFLKVMAIFLGKNYLPQVPSWIKQAILGRQVWNLQCWFYIWVFPRIGVKPPKWMVNPWKTLLKLMICGAHPYFWVDTHLPLHMFFSQSISISGETLGLCPGVSSTLGSPFSSLGNFKSKRSANVRSCGSREVASCGAR